MNKKKIYPIISILFLSLSLMACSKPSQGQEVKESTNNVKAPVAQEEVKEEAPVAQEEKKKEEPAQEALAEKPESMVLKGQVFYPSKDYIANGNEENKYVQVPIELELSKPEDLESEIRALLEADAKDPQGENFLSGGKITSLRIEDGLAYVDFNKDQLGSGSSLDEEVIIGQVVKTLTSFDGIDGVQFLVNGEKVDSLMGHYDVSHVFNSFE